MSAIHLGKGFRDQKINLINFEAQQKFLWRLTISIVKLIQRRPKSVKFQIEKYPHPYILKHFTRLKLRKTAIAKFKLI